MNENYCDWNNSYGYVLASVLHKFGNGFDEALKKYSITSKHYRVLMAVYNIKNINQKNLAETLKIDRTTTVHLIDHLEEKGYIKRQKNEKDRRSFHLVLTNKGNSIIGAICEIRDEIHNQCIKDLNENEKRVFKEICKKIGDD